MTEIFSVIFGYRCGVLFNVASRHIASRCSGSLSYNNFLSFYSISH